MGSDRLKSTHNTSLRAHIKNAPRTHTPFVRTRPRTTPAPSPLRRVSFRRVARPHEQWVALSEVAVKVKGRCLPPTRTRVKARRSIANRCVRIRRTRWARVWARDRIQSRGWRWVRAGRARGGGAGALGAYARVRGSVWFRYASFAGVDG
jgi:hypothetical protein